MHFCVHILSNEPMTVERLNQIMEPFYEGNVYARLNEENESWMPTPRPQFLWDYWDIQDPIRFHTVSDCYALIDPTGYCIARKWWDGRMLVDRTREFEIYCLEHQDEWVGKVYMVELDCHC